MSNLEAYILKKYSRWVPFSICSEELGFDVTACLAASTTKECSAGLERDTHQGGKLKGTLLEPKMRPVEYITERFTLPYEHVDHRNGGLLFSALAHLLNLNLHYRGEEI